MIFKKNRHTPSSDVVFVRHRTNSDNPLDDPCAVPYLNVAFYSSWAARDGYRVDVVDDVYDPNAIISPVPDQLEENPPTYVVLDLTARHYARAIELISQLARYSRIIVHGSIIDHHYRDLLNIYVLNDVWAVVRDCDESALNTLLAHGRENTPGAYWRDEEYPRTSTYHGKECSLEVSPANDMPGVRSGAGSIARVDAVSPDALNTRFISVSNRVAHLAITRHHSHACRWCGTWGNNDESTSPFTAEDFAHLLKRLRSTRRVTHVELGDATIFTTSKAWDKAVDAFTALGGHVTWTALLDCHADLQALIYNGQHAPLEDSRWYNSGLRGVYLDIGNASQFNEPSFDMDRLINTLLHNDIATTTHVTIGMPGETIGMTYNASTVAIQEGCANILFNLKRLHSVHISTYSPSPASGAWGHIISETMCVHCALTYKNPDFDDFRNRGQTPIAPWAEASMTLQLAILGTVRHGNNVSTQVDSGGQDRCLTMNLVATLTQLQTAQKRSK